jgi:hypothetical protein
MESRAVVQASRVSSLARDVQTFATPGFESRLDRGESMGAAIALVSLMLFVVLLAAATVSIALLSQLV